MAKSKWDQIIKGLANISSSHDRVKIVEVLIMNMTRKEKLQATKELKELFEEDLQLVLDEHEKELPEED
jgi:hypothetical protein